MPTIRQSNMEAETGQSLGFIALWGPLFRFHASLGVGGFGFRFRVQGFRFCRR